MFHQLKKKLEEIISNSPSSDDDYFLFNANDICSFENGSVSCFNNQFQQEIMGHLKIVQINSSKLLSNTYLSWKCSNDVHDESLLVNDPTNSSLDFDNADFKEFFNFLIEIKVYIFDKNNGLGHFIIKNVDFSFKIFKFHNGNLWELSNVLTKLLKNKFITSKMESTDSTVIRFLKKTKKQPIEQEIFSSNIFQAQAMDFFKYNKHVLRRKEFNNFFDGKSKLVDYSFLKRMVYYSKVHSSIKFEIWGYLLGFFTKNDFVLDLTKIANDFADRYYLLDNNRISSVNDEFYSYMTGVECLVEKDVLRTDRSNPYFSGNNNSNIETLRRILLNYAFKYPEYSYSQGMSDLVASLLEYVDDESLTFWYFEKWMFQPFGVILFVNEYQMEILQNLFLDLLDLLLPDIKKSWYEESYGEKLVPHFLHRWFLLQFRREFSIDIVHRIWEIDWSGYACVTGTFRIFVALAIVSLYGHSEKMTEYLNKDKNNNFDSMESINVRLLSYFLLLSNQMNGKKVIIEARRLILSLKSFDRIPCNLRAILPPTDDNYDGHSVPHSSCRNRCVSSNDGSSSPFYSRCSSNSTNDNDSFRVFSSRD